VTDAWDTFIPFTADEIVERCNQAIDDPSSVGEQDIADLQRLGAGWRALHTALLADAEREDGGDELTADAVRLDTVAPAGSERALWTTGWWLYEVSWVLLQRVPADWDALANRDDGGATHRQVQNVYDQVVEVADVARMLPWPQFAPRALGAIRAQALAASKRDTEVGFDQAGTLHRDGRDRHRRLSQLALGTDPALELQLGLDEAFLQLELGETGTACRKAELVLGRWTRGGVPGSSSRSAGFWARKLFNDLRSGTEVGESALARVADIERTKGLVSRKTERRLAQVTSYRNPGIMTARAYLLLLPLTTYLERIGSAPVDGKQTWDDVRETWRRQAVEALTAAEHPAGGAPFAVAHTRSIAQIRLNLAFLHPGITIQTHLTTPPCLARPTLDADTVEELSGWLAGPGPDGRRQGDANVIGTTVMPLYLAALRAYAGEAAWAAYAAWRRRWPTLDRYVEEPGRADVVSEALDDPGFT
jgi:hypothetical protein